MYEAKIESGIRNKTYVQVMNELQGAFVPSYVLMKYRNKFEVIVKACRSILAISLIFRSIELLMSSELALKVIFGLIP